MTTPLKKEEPHKEKDAATQQIAREAAQKCYNADFDRRHADEVIESYATIIERATEAEYSRGVSNGKLEALQYTPEERERYGKVVAQAEFYAAQPQPSKARKEQAPRAQGSPASGEWECPECKTRYVSNVGNCGNNLDCSRPNVVPVQREPRGQQQEWRAKNGCICFGERRWPVEYRQSAIEIVELIEATLAAEREKREKESKHLRDSLNHLQDSLAAECQRTEQEVYETPPSDDCPQGVKWSDIAKWNGLACEENQKLLLSALAAIEKHNKECPDECYEIVL